MVKPALGYLDVVRRVRDAVDVPVAAYNVSGEYAMVEAAAAQGWIDRETAILETLTSIRRAGADVVLTYWAVEAARLLDAAGELARPVRPGRRRWQPPLTGLRRSAPLREARRRALSSLHCLGRRCCHRCRARPKLVGRCSTRPTRLPSLSRTKACHSSVPAGPRVSSAWLKITCGSLLDGHAVPAQPLDRRVDVVDGEVEHGGGRVDLEHQPGAGEVEEDQAGRVVRRGGRHAEQVGVERARALEVLGPLGHLHAVASGHHGRRGSAGKPQWAGASVAACRTSPAGPWRPRRPLVRGRPGVHVVVEAGLERLRLQQLVEPVERALDRRLRQGQHLVDRRDAGRRERRDRDVGARDVDATTSRCCRHRSSRRPVVPPSVVSSSTVPPPPSVVVGSTVSSVAWVLGGFVMCASARPACRARAAAAGSW